MEKENTVEFILLSICKWDSDVSKAKLLHVAAKQKVVYAVLRLECE